MIKKTFSQFKILALCLLALFIANTVSAAGTWTNPTLTPPGGNPETPIHTAGTQGKSGGLAVGTFLSNASSLFKQDTAIKGVIVGNTNPTQNTGTAVVLGQSPLDGIGLAVSGAVKAVQELQSEPVASGIAGSTVPLCADAGGVVVPCDIPPTPPPDYCSNFDGIQDYIPDQSNLRITYVNGKYICTYNAQTAELRFDDMCDADTGPINHSNWISLGDSSDNERPTAGSYTLKLSLPNPPKAAQKLYIRLRSAHPDYHYVFMGTETQDDQWKSYEGAFHTAAVNNASDISTSSTPVTTNKPNIFPFKYSYLYPGAHKVFSYPPDHEIKWNDQLVNDNAPVTPPAPLVLNIRSGISTYYLNDNQSRFLCTAAGHGKKYKQSYIDQIEYKFEKSVQNSNDFDYTLKSYTSGSVIQRANNDLNS